MLIKLFDNLFVADSQYGDRLRTGRANVDSPTDAINLTENLDAGEPRFATKVRFIRCALRDGPGNTKADYVAAAAAVASAFERHRAVILYDHDGIMATAVAIMVAVMLSGGANKWDDVLSMLRERLGNDAIHDIKPEHRDACNDIDWVKLKEVLGVSI